MVDKVTQAAWLARLFAAAIQFLSIRLLIEFLGVQTYASFAVISSISLWMALSDFGFGLVIQNELSRRVFGRGQEIRPIGFIGAGKIIGLLFGVGVPFIVLVVGILLSLTLRGAEVDAVGFWKCLWLSNVLWACIGVMSIAYKGFYGLQKGYWANLYPAAGSAVTFGCLAILLRLSVPGEYRLLASVVAFGVPALIVSCIAGKHMLLLLRPRMSEAAEIIRVNLVDRVAMRSALKFTAFALMIQVVLNSDYVVMSYILGASEIVEYKLVASLFAFVYSLCYASLMTFWAKSSGAIERGNFLFVERAIRGNVLKSAVFIGGFAIIFIFCKDFIAALVGGGQIVISGFLIVSFAFLYFVRIWGDAYAVALASAGETKILILYLPVQVVVSVGLQFLLSSYLGVVGISLGIAISFLLTSFWINPVAYKRFAYGRSLDG